MGWLERGADWIDRHERWALGALIGFYTAIVTAQSALKLLWVDELITFYISKQPGFGGVWRALAAGADPNPPLIHLLVKASTGLFGDGALAVRLPAMLGVLLRSPRCGGCCGAGCSRSSPSPECWHLWPRGGSTMRMTLVPTRC